MERRTAAYWIEKLQLSRHIEGGSFKEVYRSGLQLSQQYLPAAFNGNRSVCTSIYFLLEQGQFSAFHRIASDELWHFYYGDPLVIYELDDNGRLTEHLLGSDFEKGQQFQCVIPAGHWFASRPAADSEYALAGCTVAPGFDFDDFELATREDLVGQFPGQSALITSLTR